MRASLREIAPLSALKIGAILSACVFVAWMVAAALIYIFLGLGGVWDRMNNLLADLIGACLLYTSPSPRDRTRSRMPSSA